MQKETALLINSLLEHLEKECSTAALIEDARGNFDGCRKTQTGQAGRIICNTRF